MGLVAPDNSVPRQVQNVAVFGAGGNLGPHVVSALQESNFTVTIYSRTTSTFTPPPNLAFHKIDFADTDALSSSLRGQDVVVATIAKDPATTLSQIILIDAAVKAGVKRFIPAEFGSDTEDAGVVARLPMFKSKLRVLNHLKAIAATNADFSYTAISNGAFFDWGLKSTFLGFNLHTHHATLYTTHPRAPHPATFTTLPTLSATLATSLLLPPSQTANRYFCIAEVRTTQAEILAALEAQTGGGWSVEGRDAAEMGREGRKLLEAGEGRGAGLCILGELYGGIGKGGTEERVRGDNKVLGVRMRGVEELVGEVLGGGGS